MSETYFGWQFAQTNLAETTSSRSDTYGETEKEKKKRKESWIAVIFYHHYNSTLLSLYPFPFRSTDTNQIERCKWPLMRTMDDDFTLDNEDA